MEPFVAVDYVGEGLVPWFGGMKRVVTKRLSVGVSWQGRENTYTLSTGVTLNTSKFLPIIFLGDIFNE